MFNVTPSRDFEDDTLHSHGSRLQNRRVESAPNTEREAFEKAIKGYKYPFYFEIGSLKNIDLIEIGQDPPNVDLETYKSLDLLDKPQLLKKASGIERFYPTITKKDLFFYLTRNRLPEDTRISEKLERLNKFERLINLNQDLLLLIYKTPEAFAEASGDTRKKNIEDVVFLYDELMGIRSTPSLISRMAGIDLRLPNPNVDDYLYWKLYRYIEISASQNPSAFYGNDIRVLDFNTTIGVKKDDWVKYMKQNFPSSTSLDSTYETRSDFVLSEFYDLDAK